MAPTPPDDRAALFPANAPTFPLYAAVIADLLPQIDDAGELKVTLYALWAVRQREGSARYLVMRDFHDAALFPHAADPAAALEAALNRATQRGTLLAETVPGDSALHLVFVNDEPGRAAAAQVRAGRTTTQPGPHPVVILPPRPTIYALYEQNIGVLTPMIRDELLAAERDYPAGWVEDAMRLAVTNNKRSWRYIRAILERWSKEGRTNHETAPRPAVGQSEQRIARSSTEFIID